MAKETSIIRSRLHEIIFEADTPASKAFDIILLIIIILSVLAVLIESVAGIRDR
jgi:voltage-gated potassium channel